MMPENYMPTARAGQRILFYEKIDSTNVQAKEEAANGASHGTLLVADMQTAGMGRRGRSWESPAGTNLYFSLILRPDFAPDKASMLTLVMALAVAEGMERVKPDELPDNFPMPEIKWPNDIVINGKKVCGILTEMSVQEGAIGHVIVGVGINVQKQAFAPQLVQTATDMETQWGLKAPREELLAHIMAAFEAYYKRFEEKGNLAELREIYNKRLVNLGREVQVLDPQGEYAGIATGINDMGELGVKLADGQMTYVYAGEVSVRGIYGYV